MQIKLFFFFVFLVFCVCYFNVSNNFRLQSNAKFNINESKLKRKQILNNHDPKWIEQIIFNLISRLNDNNLVQKMIKNKGLDNFDSILGTYQEKKFGIEWIKRNYHILSKLNTSIENNINDFLEKNLNNKQISEEFVKKVTDELLEKLKNEFLILMLKESNQEEEINLKKNMKIEFSSGLIQGITILALGKLLGFKLVSFANKLKRNKNCLNSNHFFVIEKTLPTNIDNKKTEQPENETKQFEERTESSKDEIERTEEKTEQTEIKNVENESIDEDFRRTLETLNPNKDFFNYYFDEPQEWPDEETFRHYPNDFLLRCLPSSTPELVERDIKDSLFNAIPISKLYSQSYSELKRPTEMISMPEVYSFFDEIINCKKSFTDYLNEDESRSIKKPFKLYPNLKLKLELYLARNNTFLKRKLNDTFKKYLPKTEDSQRLKNRNEAIFYTKRDTNSLFNRNKIELAEQNKKTSRRKNRRKEKYPNGCERKQVGSRRRSKTHSATTRRFYGR